MGFFLKCQAVDEDNRLISTSLYHKYCIICCLSTKDIKATRIKHIFCFAVLFRFWLSGSEMRVKSSGNTQIYHHHFDTLECVYQTWGVLLHM